MGTVTNADLFHHSGIIVPQLKEKQKKISGLHHCIQMGMPVSVIMLECEGLVSALECECLVAAFECTFSVKCKNKKNILN